MCSKLLRAFGSRSMTFLNGIALLVIFFFCVLARPISNHPLKLSTMPPYLIYVYYVALPILWDRLLPRSPFPAFVYYKTMALTTERGKAEGKQIINKQNKKEIWWRKQKRCDWQLIFHSLALSIVNYLFWRRVGEKQSCIQSFIHFAFRIQVASTSEKPWNMLHYESGLQGLINWK